MDPSPEQKDQQLEFLDSTARSELGTSAERIGVLRAPGAHTHSIVAQYRTEQGDYVVKTLESALFSKLDPETAREFGALLAKEIQQHTRELAHANIPTPEDRRIVPTEQSGIPGISEIQIFEGSEMWTAITEGDPGTFEKHIRTLIRHSETLGDKSDAGLDLQPENFCWNGRELVFVDSTPPFLKSGSTWRTLMFKNPEKTDPIMERALTAIFHTHHGRLRKLRLSLARRTPEFADTFTKNLSDADRAYFENLPVERVHDMLRIGDTAEARSIVMALGLENITDIREIMHRILPEDRSLDPYFHLSAEERAHIFQDAKTKLSEAIERG